MSKKINLRIVDPEKLEAVWEKILGEEKIGNTIFAILDFDGTLNEKDPSLLSAINRHEKKVDSAEADPVRLIVNTGRSAYERMNSTKFHGAECLAQHSNIIIAQGGAVVRISDGKEEEWILLPIMKNIYDIVEGLAESLGISEAEVFRGEHLCVNYFSHREFKEVIGIPIALEDEEVIKHILSMYDGNIISAYHAGMLPKCYTLAIEEYLDRGMPPEEIGVAYFSELGYLIITELTIVAERKALQRAKARFEVELGIQLRIQQEIADRKPGTRNAPEGIHPDISDIVAVSKKQHIDAIMKHHDLLVGFGDQANDDFLLSTPVAFVANATVIGQKGGWDFPINMAKLATEWSMDKQEAEKHCVIHAEKFGDGREINWALEGLIEKDTTKERLAYCHKLESGDRNLAIREWLCKGAIPGTNPVIR